jgi:hypothetical protein
MKPADLLYSGLGRARRGNTERTTKESGPPGQESSGLEAQGSSSFVHGFGRGRVGRGQGSNMVPFARAVDECPRKRSRTVSLFGRGLMSSQACGEMGSCDLSVPRGRARARRAS